MKKTVNLIRLIAVVIGAFLLAFAGPLQASSAQSTPPATLPKQPMLLGLNYPQPYWKDNEKLALGKLPIGIVRWGGGPSDTNENPMPIVHRFLTDISAIHNAQALYQLPFLYEQPSDEARQIQAINIDQKMGIKYWEIGNEPEYFESSHHDHTTIDDYLKQWRADAQAILAVDPTITLVGPDVSLKLTPLVQTAREWQWFDAFIKANGDLISAVSFHFYPFYPHGADDITPEAIFANADQFGKSLVNLRTYLHDTLKRDLPLFINEISLSNVGGGNNTNPAGLFAGLWLADMIGISAQQGVAAIMPWTAVRTSGLSFLDENAAPRPTYYAVQAYAGLGATVETPDGLPDGVHGYRSKADSGETIEVLINRTAKPISLTVTGTAITLGAYSMSRLHFDATGKLTDGTTFGQSEFNAQQPPSDLLHP
jgi:hypothetical protein